MLKTFRAALVVSAGLLMSNPVLGVERMKIILDTDIGTDIDDAWALGFVINYGRFEPLGVTVADGLTKDRARIALKLLHVAGRSDIPVAVGRETKGSWWHQFAWAEDYAATKPLDTPAAQFLVDAVNKYPKEVTVIAVGPLQNIADAIRLSPDFQKNIKELVLMSGCIYGRANNQPAIAEYNVWMSTQDSQTVYSSGIPTRIVPLDSTTHVQLKDEERFALTKNPSPLVRSLESLYRLWMDHPQGRMTLHDQLAVAETASPGTYFGKRETLPIVVDDKGWTKIDEARGKPITVCLEPKRDAFMTFYLDVLMGKHK
jgi:purine nucleosidase